MTDGKVPVSYIRLERTDAGEYESLVTNSFRVFPDYPSFDRTLFFGDNAAMYMSRDLSLVDDKSRVNKILKNMKETMAYFAKLNKEET